MNILYDIVDLRLSVVQLLCRFSNVSEFYNVAKVFQNIVLEF